MSTQNQPNFAEIQINPLNPGEVFACMGFFEIAERFIEKNLFAYFDADNGKFYLGSLDKTSQNIFQDVIERLKECKCRELIHISDSNKHSNENTKLSRTYPYKYEIKGKENKDKEEKNKESPIEIYINNKTNNNKTNNNETNNETNNNEINNNDEIIEILTFWKNETLKENIKTFAGQNNSYKIVSKLLNTIQSKEQSKTENFFEAIHTGSKFNFDARGGWNALNAGFSLNNEKYKIKFSAVVELLAAIGFEGTLPIENINRYCYYLWDKPLPLMLARAALRGENFYGCNLKKYSFQLEDAGKTKFFLFAEGENNEQ